MQRTTTRLALAVCVGLLIWALPRPADLDPRAWRLFAIFVAMIAGIVARPLPMGAVALIGLATVLATGTLTLSESLGGFSNGTVWLVVAAFLIAAGFRKTGLGTRIAYGLVALFGRSTLGLGYSLVASDLVLAPAIASNTARIGGVIFPILQSICDRAIARDPVTGRRTSAFLTLTVYQGTVVTSAMFLTAMVANPLVVQLAASQGIVITWTMWASAAIVPGVLSLILVPLVVYRFCRPGVTTTPEAPAMARHALKGLGPLSRDEWLMGAITLCLLVAWIFGARVGIEPAAAAIVAVAALLLTNVLAWDDVLGEREAWNTFVWFAVLLMMAGQLAQLGLFAWFSRHVSDTIGATPWVPGFLALSLIYFYSHYFFASNTAHISTMYAPFLAVALALGTPPYLAALGLAFFSNLYSCTTHYGTPPGPILFGSGHVRLSVWWKTGAVLSVVHITIWLTAGASWWRVLGLW